MMSNGQHRFPAGERTCLTVIAILFMVGLGYGQPVIRLSSTSGPATTKLQISGRGFAPNAKIDIYFDGQDKTLTMANSAGAFSQTVLQVPAAAQPGTHWVSAVGRLGHSGAQVSFAVEAAWRQFHRLNMARVNPFENVLNVGNVGNLQLQWSYFFGGEAYASPTVASGIVYGASLNNHVYAMDAKTGALLWSFPAENEVWDSPALAKGVVYFGSSDGNVYALNASTGAKLWSYAAGAVENSSPAVVDGVVYIGSSSGIVALNASSGAKL